MEYLRQGIHVRSWKMRPARSIPIGPVTCREFLVTTPAKNCQNPATETIRSVNLPMRVGPALAKLGTRGDDPSEARWVPLVLALEWWQTHAPPPRSGPDLLGELMRHLIGKELPPLAESEQMPPTQPETPKGVWGLVCISAPLKQF